VANENKLENEMVIHN